MSRMCFLGAVEGEFLFNLQACFRFRWDICSWVLLVTLAAAKYDIKVKYFTGNAAKVVY